MYLRYFPNVYEMICTSLPINHRIVHLEGLYKIKHVPSQELLYNF